MNTLVSATALLAAIALTLIWFQTYGNGLFSYVFIGVCLVIVVNTSMAVLEDIETGERVKNRRQKEK